MSLKAKLVDVIKAVPAIVAAVLVVLPAVVADGVRTVRKAVVAGATAIVGVVAALGGLPLPGNVGAVLAIVSAAASAIVTYWVPNDSA